MAEPRSPPDATKEPFIFFIAASLFFIAFSAATLDLSARLESRLARGMATVDRMSALPFDPVLAWGSMPALMRGLMTTALLTTIVLVLGLVLASLSLWPACRERRLLSVPAAAFVIFFRGAPLLILLYLVYYGFGQITALRDGPLWIVFGSAFACAIIGLTLNHAAYIVEIVRGSLLAVPAGLVEASAALG